MFATPIPNRRGHYRQRQLNVKRAHVRNLLGKNRGYDKMALYFLGGFVRVQLVSGVVFTIATTIGNADAGYLIRLKNGNEYVTNRYWYGGSQVLFDTYGGIFGIDKAFVNKIEASRQSAPLLALSSAINTRAETTSGEPIKPAREARINDLKDQKSSSVSVPKEPLKKDEEILKEYGELQNRFGQLNDLPKHEVYALDADIDSFRKKVLNSDLAEAHKEETDALATLRKAIASYLKAANP
jgi:hypothetical protein